MDLSTSHYIQLAVAMILGIGLFMVAFLAKENKIIGLLVLLIPFQPLTSRYGSINDVMVYMVFAVYLVQGKFKELPLLGSVAFIFFAYILSFTQAPRAGYLDNVIYMSAIGANFILFYLVYNYLMRVQDWRFIWKLLITLNVLIVGYSLIQAIGGAERFQILGIEELSFGQSRIWESAGTARLAGPFTATAMTSEAIVILMLITSYTIIHADKFRNKILLSGLISMDAAFLIATGNRGGIIALVLGAIMFLYFFRRDLGVMNILKISVIGTLLFAIASVVMVRYTMFNMLFDRLETTEFHGFVPDSRVGWFDIWPRLIEKPIIGHGPRMQLEGEKLRRIPGHVPMPFPHSMYLYLLYTVGIVGLLAYLLYFIRIGWRYFRSRSLKSDDDFLNGIPRLGFIILVVFAISEFRMEMFRYILRDYQQFFFVILSVFLGLTELLRRRIIMKRETTAEFS
ncbi:MAG: O-antigen ligase family protein [Thiotrichaceae bacterium]